MMREAQKIGVFAALTATLAASLAGVGCVDPHREPSAAGADAASADVEQGVEQPEHTATATPSIVSVSPSYGTTAGLTRVTILGGGFKEASDVLFGETPAVSFKVLDAGRIEATTPPRPPGAVDVTVRRRLVDEDGEVSFKDLVHAAAFTYIAPVAVSSVEPSEGTRLGGTIVTIMGAGFASDTRFVFGDRLGIDPIVIDENTATVITPAGKAGKVHVRAVNHAGQAARKHAFTYLPADDAPGAPKGEGAIAASLLNAAPYYLNVAGGTPVNVSYTPGTAQLGKVLAMRIGPLAAADVQPGASSPKGGSSLTAKAPKGSPGPADLVIVFEKGALVAKDAFVYETTLPHVAAVIPGIGAQAGGTWVRVLGSGLAKLEAVRFGPKPGIKMSIIDDALAWIWTPPGEPGPVDVIARFGPHESLLSNGFVYFDPASGNLGTWGDAIEHTVNVTVTQRYVSDGGPVQGAWVILGADPKTKHKGLTDSNGQVTFSGPDLKGPLDVHASKSDHTAASVIGVNTENVTVLIRNRHPPSQGSGTTTPPKQFSPGTIEGQVIGAQKYVQLPAGSCADHEAVQGNCAPCEKTSECSGGTTCELLTDPLAGFSLGGASAATETDQKYCAADCIQDSDCPADFECRAISLQAGNNKYRCTPRIGTPQTRCEVSRFSFFKKNDDPGKGWIADPVTGKFSIGTRLGEVAVFCRGGYVRAADGVFVALALGVVRNVIVGSGEVKKDIKVQLDIPARRQIRVRLEDLPVGPDTAGHIRFVDAKLQLGGDGWIPMGLVTTTQRTDTLELPSQPSTLGGPLKGVHYAFYAGVHNPLGAHMTPLSIAWAEKLQPATSDTFAWWPAGADKPEAKSSFAAPIQAIAQVGELAVSVGDGGSVAVWSGQGWTPQSSPTTVNLAAVALNTDGTGWAGGELGTLLRRDPVSGWLQAASPTTRQVVAITTGPTGAWLLDDAHRLFQHAGGAWRSMSAPLSKPTKTPIAPGVEIESPRLRALWQAPDGTLFAGADDGLFFVGTLSGAGKDTTVTWAKHDSGLHYRIRAFAGTSAKDVWLAGDRGALGHFDGVNVTATKTLTSQPLHALRLIDGALHAVGGQGAWFVIAGPGQTLQDKTLSAGIDLRGIVTGGNGIAAAGHAVVSIGPYLEMPYITKPAPGAGISDQIAWNHAGGNTPDLNWIEVTGYYPWAEWEIIARGDLDKVRLPSWQAIGNFSALPPGGLNLHVRRILAPSISVDRFNYKKLTLYDWTSYAHGHKQTVAGTGQSTPLP